MLRALALSVALVGCSSESRPVARPKLELVEAAPSADIAALVKSEFASAAAANKRLVVYVGAAWCEPCVRFHDAAVAGQLDDALGHVRFLQFDHDRDLAALERAGYRSTLIPLFALPNPDGTASGKQIEGSIKGDGAVAQITPRLHELLQ